jgi:hypothetical protein
LTPSEHELDAWPAAGMPPPSRRKSHAVSAPHIPANLAAPPLHGGQALRTLPDGQQAPIQRSEYRRRCRAALGAPLRRQATAAARARQRQRERRGHQRQAQLLRAAQRAARGAAATPVGRRRGLRARVGVRGGRLGARQRQQRRRRVAAQRRRVGRGLGAKRVRVRLELRARAARPSAVIV